MSDVVDAYVEAEKDLRAHCGISGQFDGIVDERESWWWLSEDERELHYSEDRGEVERAVASDDEDLGEKLYGGEVLNVCRGDVYTCIPYDTLQGRRYGTAPVFRNDREVKP